MNYVYPLLVAAGGALGALCRYMTTLVMAGWMGTSFPYGTLAVNGAGSFLIGILGVLLSRVYPLPGAAAFLITGFLGGLTTFSSFMNETCSFGLPGDGWRGWVTCLPSWPAVSCWWPWGPSWRKRYFCKRALLLMI
mgnify:CR=1 FL=1